MVPFPKMKSTTILAICIISLTQALADTNNYFMKEKYADARDKCLKENSMTIEDLNSGWSLDDIPQQNLCFHRCLTREKGMIDENGVVQKDKVSEMIDAPMLTEEEKGKVVECIGNIEKIDSCEDAKEIFACFSKNKN